MNEGTGEMRRIVKHYIFRCWGFWRRTQGAVAVELAILGPVLALLILGGMDLGHMFYIQYLTNNASREGARYAAKYTVTPTDPTSTDISNYVKLPAGLNYNSFGLDTLVVTGSYAGVSPNKIITVTAHADKHWWILSSFNFYGWLPLTNPQTLTATTAMTMER